MKNFGLLIAAILFLSGCANTGNKVTTITPLEAIKLSNQTAPQTVKGVFELTVKGYYEKQRMEFLNSELDSKDQRNLIIALRPQAVKELTDMYGQNPREFFMGKTIKVIGEAKRIKMWNTFKHRNLRNYYYQTQVFVNRASQIKTI